MLERIALFLGMFLGAIIAVTLFLGFVLGGFYVTSRLADLYGAIGGFGGFIFFAALFFAIKTYVEMGPSEHALKNHLKNVWRSK